MIGMSLMATPAQAAGSYLQCAPFARAFSGIQLFGAAYSWWQQATGRYAQGSAPQVGSVLVFKAVDSMRSGHVATVTQIVSDRIVKVTHANWSVINGRRGQVERDVTVVDASDKGDWSKVKVWYAPIKSVGQKAYPTYGFIYGSIAAAQAAVTKVADAAKIDTAS
ncbi:CHAP domain-containing protein [Sphingomonas sp. ID0503]|uniref:CHAP domain-containing protein n=1 Tax=Sphingomonas sp. ID0503 TaxID=3399691 RepID=UPI003AFAA34A